MVFVTGEYEPIIYGYYERLRGVPVLVVHQTPQVLHQASYNGVFFWLDIREIQQDGTIGKVWPVRPLQVNEFLKRRQGYVWYQYNI